MTPEQFTRACYDLGLHELPQDIKDAWREMAIGTLRILGELQTNHGAALEKFTVRDFAQNAAIECGELCIGLSKDSATYSQQILGSSVKTHSHRCAAYLAMATVAEKVNSNANRNQ